MSTGSYPDWMWYLGKFLLFIWGVVQWICVICLIKVTCSNSLFRLDMNLQNSDEMKRIYLAMTIHMVPWSCDQLSFTFLNQQFTSLYSFNFQFAVFTFTPQYMYWENWTVSEKGGKFWYETIKTVWNHQNMKSHNIHD